jgi:hypothetical protein
MKTFFCIAFAAALLTVASATRAEDFNFTVPVQLTNLPLSVEGLTVACMTVKETASAAGGAGPAGGSEVIGSASVRVPITGGAYRGDVIVRANAMQGKDPRTAEYYRCDGWFDGHERGAATHYFEPQRPQVFPLSPGAPFTLDTGFVRLNR